MQAALEASVVQQQQQDIGMDTDAASPPTMMPFCRATTTTTRCLRALAIASTLLGLPLVCADGSLPSPKEDRAAASTSGSPSSPYVFARLTHETNQAPRREPLVKFDGTASGLTGLGNEENNQETGADPGGVGVGDGGGAPVVSFTSSNDYPEITWSPWTHLAEPHRETVLRAESTTGDPDQDIFVWTMPGENGASYEGRCVGKASDTINKSRALLRAVAVSLSSARFSFIAAYQTYACLYWCGKSYSSSNSVIIPLDTYVHDVIYT